MKKINTHFKKHEQLAKIYRKNVCISLFPLMAYMSTFGTVAISQQAPASLSKEVVVRGIVISTEGTPVAGAKVELRRQDARNFEEKITDDKGAFAFSVPVSDSYSLSAEKLDKHSGTVSLQQTASQTGAKIELVLSQEGASPAPSGVPKPTSIEAMQFADQPNFTVAGVTDFTAAGGHGSDSSLRTSEALAVETSHMKADVSTRDTEGGNTSSSLSRESEARLRTAAANAPDSFEANRSLGEFYFRAGRYQDAIPPLQSAYRIDKENRENEYDLALACKAIGDSAHSKKYVQELISHQESADLYRLMGELDEALGDSLAAVRAYQKGVSLEATEQNLFAWGSELLLHRAIWQAQQVFEQGVKQYPASSRMLTGLGTALFAGAAYDESALRLCSASDLKPSDPEPYIFMGKVLMAAPNRLECIEQRLQRFVQQQPKSAAANYLYAMALRKSEQRISGAETSRQSEAFLKTAIALDPNYAEAYLQLGILYASRGNFSEAIGLYAKSIEADPELTDAYYRLAVAYDRTGQANKAKEEFELHDKIANQQAVETERQRQEVKQFIVLLPAQAPQAQTP